jgi:hypothetical protein
VSHTAIQLSPTIKRLHRHADLAHRLLNRLALTMQRLNLPKLQCNAFRVLSLSSHLMAL